MSMNPTSQKAVLPMNGNGAQPISYNVQHCPGSVSVLFALSAPRRVSNLPVQFNENFGKFFRFIQGIPPLAALMDFFLLVLGSIYQCFGDILSAVLDYLLSNRHHISIANSCDDLHNEMRWTRWVDNDIDDHGNQIPAQPANILMRSIAGESLLCANLCRLSYETQKIMTSVQQAWGVRIEAVVEKNCIVGPDSPVPYNTCAFVSSVRDDDNSLSLIVTFRGTQPFELSQWVTDASIYATPLCNDNEMADVRIHEGFASAIELYQGSYGFSTSNSSSSSSSSSSSAAAAAAAALASVPLYGPSKALLGAALPDFQLPVYLQLARILHRLAKGESKVRIVITGHSLGAALASAFSFAIAKRWKLELLPLVSGIYLFGQPKVGNEAFAVFMHNSYGNRTRRFVNHDDIVCRVPSFGFYHYGACIYVNEVGRSLRVDESTVVQNNPYSWDVLYPWRRLCEPHTMWIRRLYWLLLPTAVNDHFPGDYVRAIRKVRADLESKLCFDMLNKPPQPHLPITIVNN